jgi:hypothetical protein
MRGILAGLLVTAAILAAGCGGSSKDTSGTTAATDTSAAATTSTTDTTAGDTTSTTGQSQGCQKVADLSVEFSKALGAAGATGSGQADLQKTAEAYKAFAEKVPEEIRGSFRTLAASFALYANALKGVDLSSGKTPDAKTLAKLNNATKALDNESLSAANTKISAWVKKNCSTGG